MTLLQTGLAWSDALGLLGALLFVGSYFALQAGFIRGQGYVYASLNMAAAICLLLSLSENFNLSSAAAALAAAADLYLTLRDDDPPARKTPGMPEHLAPFLAAD